MNNNIIIMFEKIDFFILRNLVEIKQEGEGFVYCLRMGVSQLVFVKLFK